MVSQLLPGFEFGSLPLVNLSTDQQVVRVYMVGTSPEDLNSTTTPLCSDTLSVWEDHQAYKVKFMVLRVETPVMYWVRMQNMDMAKMYQKLVLGMARHFAKSEARKQLDVLERGKLVAAAGSDGVYRRARLERLVYRAR